MPQLQPARRRIDLRSPASSRPPAGAEALERVLHDLDAGPLGVVGSGAPAVAAWLRRRGHDTAAVTFALRPQARQARALPRDRWAAIVAVNWVEQTADPAAFLRQARRALSPDGRFVAVVPNITHASVRLAATSRRAPALIPRHPFTAADVERLLNSAGFTVTGVAREVDTIERLRQLGRGVADSVLDVLAEDADAMTSYFVFVAEPLGASADGTASLDVRHLAEAHQDVAAETAVLRQRLDVIDQQLLSLDRVDRLEEGASHTTARLHAAAAAIDHLRSDVDATVQRLSAADEEGQAARETLRAAVARVEVLESHAKAREGHIEAARAAMVTRAREMEALVGALERDRYQRLVDRVRSLVRRAVPKGARVLVVSRGDDELVAFDGRTGWHFPRTDTGVYAGHHPADSDDAIARLEAARRAGARFLVIPQTAAWWLEHYREFARYLDRRGRCVSRDEITGVIYALGRSRR